MEHTIEELRGILVKMNEKTMKEGGEGSVLYVEGVDEQGEQNLMICKVKTIEYRIFRKLREKLKIYIQKYNKNYENLLKKFTKEISELTREFQLNRPINEYIELAKRAFLLCEEQSRPVSRFISNRYIDFLRLLEKNVSKEKFMEIVNSNSYEGEEEEEEEKGQADSVDKEDDDSKKEEEEEEAAVKKVIVLIPLTIPSTGKSTLLETMKTMEPTFRIWSISSDEIRAQLM
jgi:hypothetical protein